MKSRHATPRPARARARGLTPAQERHVRRLLLTRGGRTLVRDELAPAASEERIAWTWGRQLGAPKITSVWAPPPRVGIVCTIEKTLYRAAKGRGKKTDNWEHKHDRPFMLLAGSACPAQKSRRSVDAVQPTGKAVVRLGELLELEGTDPAGRRVVVSFKRRRVLLVGEPITHRMMIAGAQLCVLRNGSPCLVTPDGLVR